MYLLGHGPQRKSSLLPSLRATQEDNKTPLIRTCRIHTKRASSFYPSPSLNNDPLQSPLLLTTDNRKTT